MHIIHRAAAVGIAAIAAVVLFAGCSSSPTTSGSDGSRVKSYSSLAALAGDSTVIVSGTVTAQRTAADIDPVTPFTISTVTVQAAPKGAGLVAGSTVEVRQFGSTKQIGPAPLLTMGSHYLLYLTASGLSGPLASQYYVTGGDAGLYAAPPSAKGNSSFNQMRSDKNDKLPAAVTLTGAIG